MALRDSTKLFDILVRLQVFVEGVKANESFLFNEILREVNEEFKKILGRIKYSTLDGLTKAELNKLVVLLRASQSKLYSKYTRELIERLQLFTKASLKVNRIVYASSFTEVELNEEDVIFSDEEAARIIEEENEENDFIALFGLAAVTATSPKSMWAKIINEPLPSSGAMLTPFIKGFGVSASVNIENTLRKGYSNAWTANETIVEATSQLNKAAAQSEAVIATAMQHVQSMVSAGISSAMFGRYRWISILDNATTDICRSLSQTIHTYGKGPLPPAHVRCRSMIAPYFGESMKIDTFLGWFKRQSKGFQDLALGTSAANLFRAGKAEAKDLSKLRNPKKVSIESFQEAAEAIITGDL